MQGSGTPRSSLTLEADSEDSASETETSPAWRRESLKKATQINRIDSQTAAMKQRCRRNATVERPQQFVFGLDVSDDDETNTREPSPDDDSQHSNGAERDRSDGSPDVSAKGTLSRTSPSVHNSDGMSSSSTVDNSDANISELPKTTPLSSHFGVTSEASLVTSCSSPGPLSCSSQQGSDPWLPRSEPDMCLEHGAERTEAADCDRSSCRSSVSPQRGFGCGSLLRSNSCSSLGDSVGDQCGSGHGCSTNVLQSPRMTRQNMVESASGDKQEGRTYLEQGGDVAVCVTSPKTDTTTECSFCGGRDVDVNNATPVRCACTKPPSGSIVGSPRPLPRLNVYIPKYVTPNVKRFSTSRSNSFTDATQHAVKTAISPTLSSPSSTTSTDSLIDSLRNTVGNIRSRLTRRHASGNSNRMQRSRSASALDRIVPPSSPSREVPTKEKGRRRQNIFVQHLKRTYSEREHKGNRFGGSAVISPGGDRKRDDASNELMDLLKDKKQGSPAIGARYATPRPCSSNSYTLPNGKRPSSKSETDDTLVNTDNDAETPPPTQPTSQLNPNVVTTRAMTETRDDRRLAYDSGCVDTDILSASQSDISRGGADVTTENVSDEMLKQLEIGSRNTLDSAETISNAPSVDSYYERRLAEELGMDAACDDEDAVFRDSAIYSDDGVLLRAGDAFVARTAGKCAAQCIDSSTADNGTTSEEYVNNTGAESDNETGATVSVTGINSIIGDIAQSKQLVICDNVKSIHQRYNSASNAHAKSTQKRINKSPAFQDIVFNLEAGSGSELSESPSPDVDACVSPSFKTAASRELVHCASLTRMRQDNASISDKHYTEEWPPRQRSKSQESDDDVLSMRIDDTVPSPVNRARPLLDPVTHTPLSHPRLSLSPSAETNTLLSSTPHPKFLWSPSSQFRAGSSLDKRKDVWPWSPVPTIASPDVEVANEPTSESEYEELQCPSAMPYKARLTVNVHSMCADPTTDESAPDPPFSDSPAAAPMSPARRGWVKYRVKQLQGDDEAA